MVVVNVEEAKSRLSALLVSVERGEDVTIARDGTPVARLVPAQAPQRRPFGTMKFDVPDDFNAPLPEAELTAWESRRMEPDPGRPSAQRS